MGYNTIKGVLLEMHCSSTHKLLLLLLLWWCSGAHSPVVTAFQLFL